MVFGCRPSKTRVFCDFQYARATLCGLWAGRPSKTRGFLRCSNRPRDPLTLCGLWAGRPSKNSRPRDPLRTLGWSTFENLWFFAIFKSPARPSADFGLVDLRKLVVFYDFQIARATLCGLWAGRPSKTRGFLRFSNRPRNPLRSLGWSTFQKLVVFLRFPNHPRDPLRSFARLNRSHCGAARIFLRP